MNGEHRFFVTPDDIYECNHIECNGCTYANLVKEIEKCINKERRAYLWWWKK